MRKRSSISGSPPGDEGDTAYRAAQELLSAVEGANEGKNPAAVLLGRLGGKKGGPARAKKLSARERSVIARRAARARWKEHRRGTD